VASVPVRARLEARGPVVVTQRPVARGAMLQAEDLTVEERDLGGSAANVVTAPEAVIGMQARVPLAAGTPLTFQALESPLLVRRGDVVTVVVETPGMRLSVAGEAQEQGAAGDPVRVLNRKSQQELSGRVIDRGVVLVQY
jgi:flagella basal body P-ring formation protein FlgA